jgi:hypothetical protein
MYRIITGLFLLLVSVAASSAQGLLPAVWQGQRGSVLKVLAVDKAHSAQANGRGSTQ